MLICLILLFPAADIAQRFHINKYPVIKLFRFGKPAKREYKGSRSAEAIQAFIQSQKKETVKVWENDDEMNKNIDVSYIHIQCRH